MEQWVDLVSFILSFILGLIIGFGCAVPFLRHLSKQNREFISYIMVQKDSASYYATRPAVKHAPSDSDVKEDKLNRRRDQEYIKAMTNGVVDDDVIELIGTKDGVIS